MTELTRLELLRARLTLTAASLARRLLVRRIRRTGGPYLARAGVDVERLSV